MKITAKIPLLVILAAFVSGLTIGVLSYQQARESIFEGVKNKFIALLDAKKITLSDYLESIREDVRIESADASTLGAIVDFRKAWLELKTDPTPYLKDLYITNNPYPTGEKDNLIFAGDSSSYSKVHNKYHHWFRKLQKERGYYDIFLFDLEGNLIYTVFKEQDYATNFFNGEWKDTGLGTVYRNAVASEDPDTIYFTDFAPYGPSHGDPASFIAKKVIDINGNSLGVIAFQMPIDRINRVMQVTSGLGKTGETYIVTGELLMCTDSRFDPEKSSILSTKVDTNQAQKALSGETGILIGEDYLGEKVFAVYTPFEFMDVRWALIGEIRLDEIMAPTYSLRNTISIMIVAIIAIIALLGYIISFGITTPMARVVGFISRLQGGERDFTIEYQKRKDEIGDIARSLQSFKDVLIETEELNVEIAQHQHERRALDAERIKALKESKKSAEEANKTKSEFLANMSHELRTPMHAILSFSKFCIKDLKKFVESDYKKSDLVEEIDFNLGSIHDSGSRLLSLINDLLDLEKLEAGKIELNRGENCIVSLIDSTLNELKSLLDDKKISIIFDKPAFSTMADFDRDKIAQVTTNVLSNAIKFTPEGKSIIIDIEQTSFNDKDSLLIKFTDQGVGIPEGELDDVFDKFIQSSKTKTGAGGTGLGLAICKQIVELHGGKIWAENAKDGGATFNIILNI